MSKVSVLFLLMVASIAAIAQGPNNGVSVQIEPQSGAGRFCLDARGNRDQDGVPVFIYQCHGSENQRWTITTSEDNRHAIVGIGGYCLDVRGINSTGNGTPTQLWKCHFGDNQRFSLEPDGRIREIRSGKCLIATAAQDAAPLVLDTCKNTEREVFMIRH